MWGWIKIIFGLLPALLTYLHDRRQQQAGADAVIVKQEAQTIKEVKDANEIRANPDLPDELLIPPEQRGK